MNLSRDPVYKWLPLSRLDAEKLCACFSGISKWDLSLHLSSLNNLQEELSVVMKSLLQPNTIITPHLSILPSSAASDK